MRWLAETFGRGDGVTFLLVLGIGIGWLADALWPRDGHSERETE